MEKRVLMVVHDRSSSVGRVGHKLAERGYVHDVRCVVCGDDLPEILDDYAAAIVFGGVMSANDTDTNPAIRAELAWIDTALDSARPFLGICLGAQLLARALGARVCAHPEDLAEIGYFPVRPTAAGRRVLSQPMNVYHWHREGFELPASAQLLVEGERFPNQAFAYGDSAVGLQFHPEVTLEVMQVWMREASDSLELPGAQTREVQLVGHSRFDDDIDAWLDGFLDSWLNGVDPSPR